MRNTIAAFTASLLACCAGGVALAEVPQAAVKLLSEKGLDVEQIRKAEARDLAIPSDWLEKAKAEGKVTYISTSTADQAARYLAAFRERYPDVEVEFIEGVGSNTTTQPLMAYKAGSLLTDVIAAFGQVMPDYRQADALEPLSDLPALQNVPEEKRDPQNRWSSLNQANWCIAYNPKKISEDQLPKTWWDLVAKGTVYSDGRVGLANRPHVWLINLWGKYGAERITNEFIPAFFENLKPQLRSEGQDGVLKLAAAGEFDIQVPTQTATMKYWQGEGMKMELHCLDQVPQNYHEIGMFRNSPSRYSAKILINWLLSAEGQASRYAATDLAPVHKDLQGDSYVVFADKLKGKQIMPRTNDLYDQMPALYEVWNKAWERSGGKL